MQNRRIYRIALAVVCFIFAGIKAFQIIRGDYRWEDVFFLVAFLGFGTMYLLVLRKNK